MIDIARQPNGRFAIIVNDLSQADRSAYLSEIYGLVADKRISGIADLRDENNGLVIDVKRDGNPHRVLHDIFKKTTLPHPGVVAS